MNNKDLYMVVGGGGNQKNTPKNSLGFKPLIASSLALALGVSVASADITLNIGGSSVNSVGSNFGNNGGYDIFQSNNAQVTNLMIWVGGTSTNFNTSKNPYELQTAGDTILTSTSGLSMTESGTLYISNYYSALRNFTLELGSLTTSTNYAIQGNLSLEGGGGNTGTITATFGGKGISGNLTLKSGTNNLGFNNSSATIGGNITINDGTHTLTFSSANYGTSESKKTITASGGTTTISGLTNMYADIKKATSTSNSSITFNSKTNMFGNIGGIPNGSWNVGALVVNFSAGSILHGYIQNGNSSNANDFVKNEINFSGASSADEKVMQGNIVSYGIGSVWSTDTENRGNHVNFIQGSMQGNILATGINSRSGFNEVKFSNDGGGQSITGNITANGSNFSAKNSIIFSNGGSINGNISASSASSSNTINFQGNNRAIIAGNSISSNNGINTITFANGNATINANISNSAGTNNITANNTTLAIQGNISSQWGSNSISAQALNLGTSGSAISLNVGGNNSTSTASNTITATNALTAYFSSIQSSGSGSGAHTNTISGGSGSNVSIGSMSATATTKNTNTINITGGTLNVTGSITANSGTNSITSGATNTFSTINNSDGINTINASTSSSTSVNGNISAQWGSNSISAQALNLGTEESKISLLVSGGSATKTASNTITASGALTAYISTMKAYEGNYYQNGRTNGRHLNLISAGNGSNINIDDITVSDDAKNANIIKMVDGNLKAITMTANSGSNIVSADNGTNTLSFTTISSTSANGINYIAKNAATNSDLTTSLETNWADTTYQANGTLTVSGNISTRNSKNFINVSNIQVSGAIDSNGTSVNNIAATTLNVGTIKARWNGRNNIVITNTPSTDIRGGSYNLSGNILAGGSDNSGNNYIYFSNVAANTSISLSATQGANYLSIENSTNNVAVSTMSAEKGTNYLAKSILSNNNGTLSVQNTSANGSWWASDDQAFTGSLSINSVTSSGSGANYISYKADSTATSAIISNLVTSEGDSLTTTLGTAVSGNNNNIYLNVSNSDLQSGVAALQQTAQNPTNATQLKNATVILGNIVSSGGTNIKIVGTANAVTPDVSESKTITNKNQIGILGNINTTAGTTNIVLEDTFFAPSAIIVDNTQQPSTGKITMPFGGENAGNITTASGAATNIVTRFTADVKPTGVSMYSVNGAGTTNIAIQGNIDVGTYINYSNGSHVNLIFANASDGTTDSFSATTNIADNSILGVTYQNGVKLSIADKTIMIGDKTASFLDTYGSYYTDGSTPLATVWANRTDDRDVVAISGLVVGNISNLMANNTNPKTYDVTLKSGSAFAGNINLNSSTTTAINIVMEKNSKLILSDAEDGSSSNLFIISNLDIKDGAVDQYQLQTETLKQTNNVINIATGGASANNVATRESFRLLAIGNTQANGTSMGAENTGLFGSGTAVFMTYVNTHANQDNATLGGVSSSGKTAGVSTRARTATDGQYGNLYSDRIIIANIGDNSTAQSGTYYMQFAVDADSKLNSVTYNASNDKNTSGGGGTKTAGNIAVLTVVNTGAEGSKTAGITLKTQDVLQGFDRIGGDLIAVETDITGEAGAGKTGYTTYFINALTTRGATEATQEVTASAFATNYDLYFANFNSLNKRMGELRDNDNSQGAWARIFNGSQSNDFTKSKSTYTTFQGGYDYAFGFEGANNYLGVALSYAMSSSKNDLNALDITGDTKNIDNVKSSAVEVALYNSYVQDEGWYNDTIAKFSYIFSDFTITGQESKYSTTNMAFTLSNEFGYRFKLGSEKEWYIDPQLEFAVGYFNQSDFIQTLGLSSLEGVADGIITTRTRFGSSFGYDFKKFTANKPIKASIYVGAFYEYDYISGGDVTLTTNLGGVTTNSSAVSSDGRVVMNVGTNMTIKDNTRIYFDFESSFAGKINTDYQVNVGVRYSFGENTSYTPMTAKREVAPLKVSEEKAEESKEVENTESKTEENKAQ